MLLSSATALVLAPKKGFKTNGIPVGDPANTSASDGAKLDQLAYCGKPACKKAAVYMSMRNDNKVNVVDAKSGALLNTLPYATPKGIAVNEALGLLYVCASKAGTGTVSAVNLSAPFSATPVWSVLVPGCDILKQYGDLIYVTGSGGLIVLSAKTGAASGSAVALPSAEEFTVSDQSRAIYVSGGPGSSKMFVADKTTRLRLFDFDAGPTFTSLYAHALDADDNRLYISAQGTVAKAPAPKPVVRAPTSRPTKAPTKAPTRAPTRAPSRRPTKSPTKVNSCSKKGGRGVFFLPSFASHFLLQVPTKSPTRAPTKVPTKAPTMNPTKAPTRAPTLAPTRSPTSSPTQAPTRGPTKNPTANPTRAPTFMPTSAPTVTPIYPPAFVVLSLIDGSVVFSYPNVAAGCNGIYPDEDPTLYPAYSQYIYVTCAGTPSTPGALYTFGAINPNAWATPEYPLGTAEKYSLVDVQPLPSMARMALWVPSKLTLYVGVPALPASAALGRTTAQPAQLLAFTRKKGTGFSPDMAGACAARTGMAAGGAAAVTFFITVGVIGGWLFYAKKNPAGAAKVEKGVGALRAGVQSWVGAKLGGGKYGEKLEEEGEKKEGGGLGAWVNKVKSATKGAIVAVETKAGGKEGKEKGEFV